MKNEEKIWDFLTEISIPRFVGTSGHETIKNKIKETLTSIPGLKCTEQNFPAYLKGFRLSNLVILMMSLLILGIPVCYAFNKILLGFIFTFCVLILTFLLFPIKNAASRHQLTNPQTISGTNLIFQQIPMKKENNQKKENIADHKKNTIVILSHYDSITRPYPIILNIVFYVIGFLGGFIFLIQSLTFAVKILFFHKEITSWMPLLWGIVVAIVLILFIFDSPKNQTPGALDNGSGVACLYYLAKTFQAQPIKNTDLVFVATDAEELGNLGAKAFIEKYENKYPQESTYFIIVDTIGVPTTNRIVSGSIFPKRDYSLFLEKKARDLLTQMAQNQNNEEMKDLNYKTIPKKELPLTMFKFPPFLAVESDHNPIMNRKYEFLLFGGVSGDLHTPRDNLDSINHQKFVEICDFLEHFIIEISDTTESPK